MRTEKNSVQTKMEKIIVAFLVLFTVVFIGSKLTYYYIENSIPAPIRSLVKSAKSSKKILTKTGEIVSEEYTYNENDFKKDSLKLHIKLRGNKASVRINVVAVRNARTGWVVCRSDTIFEE